MTPRELTQKRIQQFKESGLPRPRTTFKKAVSYAKSMTSTVLHGPASDAVISLRVLSCHGDTTMAPCAYRRKSASGVYYVCLACGCGDHDGARLNDRIGPEGEPLFFAPTQGKLRHHYLECPIDCPGFSQPETGDLITPEAGAEALRKSREDKISDEILAYLGKTRKEK